MTRNHPRIELANDSGWPDLFQDAPEATEYKRRIEAEVPLLMTSVRLGVEATLAHLDKKHPEYPWAAISAADVQFCDSSVREPRVIAAYKNAIPENRPFAIDAVSRQLELFASLGFRAELAQKVIAEITAASRAAAVNESGDGANSGSTVAGGKAVGTRLKRHLIVFAGHRVDAPDRPQSRFPASAVARARELLRDAVMSLRDGEHELLALASASPSTDIIAHELCFELGLPSTICLPMARAEYVREVLCDLDEWRTRLLDLTSQRPVLELSARTGLPNWLHDSKTDPWERGNRWVLQMAQCAGADRVTLVALWDHKDEGDAPGGTADMIGLISLATPDRDSTKAHRLGGAAQVATRLLTPGGLTPAPGFPVRSLA